MQKQLFTKTRWLVTIILLITLCIGNTWAAVSLTYEWTVSAGKGSLPSGVTHSGLGTNYGDNQAPYYLKYDTQGDYIQIQTDATATQVKFRVKMIGGNSTSKFKVQGSANGSTFTDIQEFTCSGATNDVKTFVTTNSISSTYRYFRIIMSQKGSNVGFGYLKINGICSAIDVTDGNPVILPAGSTSYTSGDWKKKGAPDAYPDVAEAVNIGSSSYCTTMYYAADNGGTPANGLHFKASTGYIEISDIVSTNGIDVDFVCSGTNGFKVELTGASDKAAQTGTVTISTTSTTATLKITKNTANEGYVTYIRITPKTASCSATPTIGNASINSSFTLTALTDNIGYTQGLSSGTCNTGNAGCSWSDRGFVWGTTSSPTTSDHKEAGGSGDQATSWTGTLHPSSSWAVGTPYYVKTYGQNSNPSGSIVYSTTATSFTLRSIDFEENGGSTVNMIYCNSGGTATKPTDPTKDGNTFAGWYKEAGLNNAVDWENDAVSENKTYYAKWNTTVCTITLNQNGATTSSSPTSVNATYGSGSLSSAITNPEKTDYIFGGWYSGSGGTGSLVIGTDGTLQANVAGYTDASGNWAKDATSTTLYANWTAHTYTNYRTSCCPTKVTLVGSVPSGHGTVTFSPTGPVTTCEEDKEVTMTITPDAGYQLTAFTTSGVSPKSTGAIATSGDASKTTQNVTVTFNEDQATGTYTGIATFSIMTDYYKDKLHNTTGYTGDGATRSGGNYSVPDDISNTTPGSGCENEHYVFVGWVDAGHVAADGSLLSGYSLFKGGTKDASGTTYYAIWAKDIE